MTQRNSVLGDTIRHRLPLGAVILALTVLSALAGCALLRPKPPPLLRPGCVFRVVDELAGLPIPGVQITVVTLHAGRDTVAKWSFTTNSEGFASFLSLRMSAADVKPLRPGGEYSYVASFEKPGYCFYSQQIGAPVHRIVLSRKCLVAMTDGNRCPRPVSDPDRLPPARG